MLTRRELKGVTIKKKQRKWVAVHISAIVFRKKNPERENWVAEDLFSDSIDTIIVIFILFLPFLWCSVKLSSLSVSFLFFNHYWKNWRSPLFLLYKICISLISASALKIIWFTVLFCFFFLPSLPPFPRFLFVFAIIISSTHYGFACQVLHALHHRGLSISHMEKT